MQAANFNDGAGPCRAGPGCAHGALGAVGGGAGTPLFGAPAWGLAERTADSGASRPVSSRQHLFQQRNCPKWGMLGVNETHTHARTHTDTSFRGWTRQRRVWS